MTVGYRSLGVRSGTWCQEVADWRVDEGETRAEEQEGDRGRDVTYYRRREELVGCRRNRDRQNDRVDTSWESEGRCTTPRRNCWSRVESKGGVYPEERRRLVDLVRPVGWRSGRGRIYRNTPPGDKRRRRPYFEIFPSVFRTDRIRVVVVVDIVGLRVSSTSEL